MDLNDSYLLNNPTGGTKLNEISRRATRIADGLNIPDQPFSWDAAAEYAKCADQLLGPLPQ